MFEYKTHGTCARQIRFELEDGKVRRVQFVDGCSGNTQGISRLVEGMDAREAAARLKGIRCGRKSTSCPDQLALALEEALAAEAKE